MWYFQLNTKKAFEALWSEHGNPWISHSSHQCFFSISGNNRQKLHSLQSSNRIFIRGQPSMAPTVNSKLGTGCRESGKDNCTCIWGCLHRKHPPPREPQEARGTPALCPSKWEETKINRGVTGHRTLLKHKEQALKTDNQIGIFRVRLWPLLLPIHYE